ncbi:GMC family oxidoreductase [Desulfovibrio subterraneus]|uniref:GMC family oxidoreductase n=1 Tax=Desulfovibrio subterraneus TaxID=2718620 RepID=UPI0022B8DDC9|nr:GMC family oxidoreductase [Desulfovibrio subterraneus]WBF68859.1 GMC family oxidoreductase [Desulfovibrio subterraneus]
MAKELKKVNVVTVGVGFMGGVTLAECAKAGLSVVGLERGAPRGLEDFLEIHDEWRYAINYGLMQDLSKETITFRNSESMPALPMRRLGSFCLGDGLGGAGVHWNAMNYRFKPYDFQIKTLTEERYGKNKIGPDYQLQDYPLTYDEMEPYFTQFEYAIGVSGTPGPFDGKRSKPWPMPPLAKTPAMKLFEESTKNLGYHPYPIPAAIASEPYTTSDGMQLNPCQYCGYCERFACEYDAKAQPTNTFIPAAMKTGNCEIRCHCNVVEILHKNGKASGVRYVNTLTQEEFIQPADVVVLSSYVLNNAKLLMTSKIGTMYDPKTGKGTLGKGYCYQITPGASVFLKEPLNLYAGAGALGMVIDDFNADAFDHSNLDFIHGGSIALAQTGKRPIGTNPTPSGTPRWGADFKKQSTHYFNRTLGVGSQGASMPHKHNFLDLDPTYKDAYGLPLLRMTYNFTDHDKALFSFISKKIEEIVKGMNPESIAVKGMIKDYNIVPYQTTHNTGGTITGKSPEDSVVNSYMQHWDAENLFVVGAGNFTHNGGCNPTGTIGALAFRCAEGIIKYARKGGMLA